MRDFTIAQQIALIGLEGQSSTHKSLAKSMVLKSLAAAQALDQLLAEQKDRDPALFCGQLKKALNQMKSVSGSMWKEIEKEIAQPLLAEGVLEEIPDILACDMHYVTAGLSLKAYRSLYDVYQRIIESIRAEILENGPVCIETVSILWLLRESGGIHDIFSTKEQELVSRRLKEITAVNPLYRGILELEFHNGFEVLIHNFLNFKRNLFRNPYLQGVTLFFPYFERRQAIFIDFVTLGTTVSGRRQAVINFLSEKGHLVEEFKLEDEVLLKINNSYYRIFPFAKASVVPVQGVNLVPVYW